MGTDVPPAPAGVGTGFRRAHRDAHSGRVAGRSGANGWRASSQRLPAFAAVPRGGRTRGPADPPTSRSGGEPLLSAIQGSAAARRGAGVVVPAVGQTIVLC